MSMWRCPHCGTPQPESSRCWVCHRSSTTCSTCRNFRRAVAGQLGYCGLDRRRLPLAGSELKGCWERAAARASTPAGIAAPAAPGTADPASRLRDFVPVELGRDRRTVVDGRRGRDGNEPVGAPGPGASDAGRWSPPPPGDPIEPPLPAATLDLERSGSRLTLFGEMDRGGS